MDKVTRTVSVTQDVEVTVDRSAFTPEFMEEFARDFYESVRTVEDHIEYLARLYARGLVDDDSRFIEGYGPPSDFGISFDTLHVNSDFL